MVQREKEDREAGDTQSAGDGSAVDSHAQSMLRNIEKYSVSRVAVSSLTEADSPRQVGENTEHARRLAASGAVLPAIIVHRETMRVIDGMHRLRAAMLRGETEIDVRFFDGSLDDAFVIAVEANIAHGLPLSTGDRAVAAERIVGSHSEWSDRTIAAATGLAAKTVGAIRKRVCEGMPSTTRIGRDGRSRPLNGVTGRLLACDMLRADPNTSVREVARAAGVSPSTVHDVSKRLRDGEDPIPPKQRQSSPSPKPPPADHSDEPISPHGVSDSKSSNRVDYVSRLRKLCEDPSLRFNEAGRSLLRWLGSAAIDPEGWTRILSNIPSHRTREIVELARQNALVWQQFADQVEVNGNST